MTKTKGHVRAGWYSASIRKDVLDRIRKDAGLCRLSVSSAVDVLLNSWDRVPENQKIQSLQKK